MIINITFTIIITAIITITVSDRNHLLDHHNWKWHIPIIFHGIIILAALFSIS